VKVHAAKPFHDHAGAEIRRESQHHVGLIVAHVVQVDHALHVQMNVRIFLREGADGRSCKEY
jgi:hypothetical protein